MRDSKNLGWSLIPPSILTTEDLSNGQKILLGRILGLIGDEGYCWASNKYLAKNLDLTPSTVSSYISELVKRGYLERKLVRDEETAEVKERRLYSPTNIGKVPNNSRGGGPQQTSKGSVEFSKRVDNSNSLSNPKEKYNEHAPLNGRGLDYDKIKDMWNSQVPEDVQIRSMTDHRKEKLRKRFKEPGFNLGEIIEEVNQSNFLVNELNPNLFTWIVKNQDNYTKTLEGSYRDKSSKGSSGPVYDTVTEEDKEAWK